MLTLHPLKMHSPHAADAQALYERAFPENERRDFSAMLTDSSGFCDLVSIEDEGSFIGFACTLCCIDIAHIIYFAIEESLRGHGLGSQVLHMLHERYAPQRVMVDIERCGTTYPDHAQRLARKAFYLRAGYQETPVSYRWQQEDYDVLCYGGTVSYEEFCRFWDAAYAANPNIG